MRIIAGELGGRIFAAPHGHRTHPMSDKMRGALFNALGDISDLKMLDAFAGSGALAFEALSRGAAHATLLERDRLAQQTVTENITALELQNHARLVKASANAWLSTTTDVFDLIILDPPYDDLQQPLVSRLAKRLTAGGVLVLSWPGKQQPPDIKGLHKDDSKRYGDGSLHFYREESAVTISE